MESYFIKAFNKVDYELWPVEFYGRDVIKSATTID